jgi:hypothetical protein
MRTLISIPLWLIAIPVMAKSPARYPLASTTCQFQGKTFAVKLETVFEPGDPSNDVGGGQFLTVDSHEVEIQKKMKPPYLSLSFLDPDPDDSSLCDKTQAYAVGGKVVAILYTTDNSPFQDILRAVFYDPSKRQIVKVEKNFGPLKDTIATKDGFAFSTVIPRSDADEISIEGPWGKELSGSDDDLGAYSRVTYDKNTVSVSLDPDLSYENSPWKKFYNNKEEYFKDAGWDPKTKSFKNVVVYSLTHFNRNESNEEQQCIWMTSKRAKGKAPLEDKRHCVKFTPH